MPDSANHVEQEYWQPPVHAERAEPARVVVREEQEVCPRCNTEFVLGSRFCYVCGREREPQGSSSTPAAIRFLDFHLIRNALGLTIGSLVAFIFGIACVIAAVVTGFIYTAQTVLDWQAVQVWRLEWLVAAIAAFAAGILLKRTQ
jgi:hypothetical protein